MSNSLNALLVFLLCGYAYAGEQPAAEALKLETPPVLDGRLDEACWESARPLGDFHVFGKDAAGRRVRDTEIRLAYDDAWLYLGCRCDNPLQQLVLDPKTRAHDGPVATDEAVELFLSSDGAGKVYYHFMLSCFNVKTEQRIIHDVFERETWNLPWRSATAVTDTGWTAEIAIPLYLFVEYGDLEHIRLNIARNRRAPHLDTSHAITHETQEHSVWRPVAQSYHEPSAFGALAALNPGQLRMPFLPVLERAEVRPYFTDGGTNYYGVELTLKGANAVTGEVEAVVVDRPVTGAATVVRERVGLPGPRPVALALSVPVAAPAERSITVALRDPASGETWQNVFLEKPAVLTVMHAWLDRNYYTAETQAVAVAEIGMPAAALRDLRVAVEIGGKTIAAAPAAQETALAFSLREFAAGRHPVRIALQRSDGAPFAALDVELIKRAPRPGCEVKIDQVNRVVLKDGAPVFPLGLIMAGIAPENDAAFQDIADAGCNSFLEWHWRLSPAVAAGFPARARQHGLTYATRLNLGWKNPGPGFHPPGNLGTAAVARLLSGEDCVGLLMSDLAHYDQPTKTAIYREYVNYNLPVLEEYVRAIQSSTNLLAYFSIDEPFDRRIFDMTGSLADIYRATHAADGYRPVMLNYSSYIPAGDEFVTPCDILCTDPYWVPGGMPIPGPGRSTPNFVSKIVHWTDQRAEQFRKAVWIVPNAPVAWSQLRKRVLTGAELDCQNFLAIIHGAKGLFWFRYPMDAAAWESMRRPIAKVKIIGPMAVQPAVRQNVAYTWAAAPAGNYQPARFIPEKEEYPDVQCRIFRDPADGGLVLLAANSRYYPVTAAFTVAGLSGTVRRIFADKALPLKDGVFQEVLEPFAVRAYRLGGKLAEPVALAVAALRPESVPPPETAWANNVRPGKKNVFPNPSFEETTVPGLPDYYHGEFVLAAPGQARFGENAIMLTRRADALAPTPLNWSCAPQHDQPAPYVLSFWAKGAQGGEKLLVRHRVSQTQTTIVLTNAWRRWEFPAIVIPPRQKPDRDDFLVYLMNGAAWLDGMQLEAGYQATEFED